MDAMAQGKGSIVLPPAYRGREQAYIKHHLLETYLEKLFMIVGMGASQLGIKGLSYVDCFAGPWGDDSESLDTTSIAISLGVLAGCREALLKAGIKLSFKALYIEKDPAAFVRLERYLKSHKREGVDAESLRGDFADLIPAITEWANDDSFAFFFVDPTAWLPVSVGVLQPLLERAQSEFVINFMYDFASRAASISGLRQQTAQLLGEEPDVGDLHGLARERALLGIYRRNLKRLVPTMPQWPARAAYLRVLDPEKNRPKYHLVHLTTHPLGLIEFMEAAEKLDFIQKQVRATTRQQRREEKTRNSELFVDAEQVREEDGHVSVEQVERYWLSHLTREPQRFGQAKFADMLEQTDWFPGDLQGALGSLIKKGMVRNLDAASKRRTKFLHFDERLQLTGGKQ